MTTAIKPNSAAGRLMAARVTAQAKRPEIVAAKLSTQAVSANATDLPEMIFNCSNLGLTVHTNSAGKVHFIPTSNGRSYFTTKNPLLQEELRQLADRNGRFTYINQA